MGDLDWRLASIVLVFALVPIGVVVDMLIHPRRVMWLDQQQLPPHQIRQSARLYTHEEVVAELRQLRTELDGMRRHVITAMNNAIYTKPFYR